MKIKINTNNKFFFKKSTINKERGENILLGAGDGSGRSLILLNFLHALISEGHVDRSSVFINLLGDNSMFLYFISYLKDLGYSDINDFYLFNGLTYGSEENSYDNLLDVDFKSKTLQRRLVNTHIFFAIPSPTTTPKEICDKFKNKLFDYMENLPINKGKEIPVIIDNISHFSNEDFDEYEELMKEVNVKGYFFITSVCGMFNYVDVEKTFCKLKKMHKHILMANSQVGLENKHICDISLKIKLNNMICGSFYYFKDFVLQNKSPLCFTNKGGISKPVNFPKFRRISDLIKK